MPKRKLLLIDEQQNRWNHLVGQLAGDHESEHWQVDTVQNGLAAALCARDEKYDLILSDHAMLDLMRENFLSSLRGPHGPNQQTWVVMLSDTPLSDENQGENGLVQIFDRATDTQELIKFSRQKLKLP